MKARSSLSSRGKSNSSPASTSRSIAQSRAFRRGSVFAMFRQVSEAARWRRGWLCAIECALLGALLCAVVPAARAADDPKAASAELSNQAFALLNSLNAGGADRGANPLLGQVAGFAGDAQTLSQALSAGDKGGARWPRLSPTPRRSTPRSRRIAERSTRTDGKH